MGSRVRAPRRPGNRHKGNVFKKRAVEVYVRREGAVDGENSFNGFREGCYYANTEILLCFRVEFERTGGGVARRRNTL